MLTSRRARWWNIHRHPCIVPRPSDTASPSGPPVSSGSGTPSNSNPVPGSPSQVTIETTITSGGLLYTTTLDTASAQIVKPTQATITTVVTTGALAYTTTLDTVSATVEIVSHFLEFHPYLIALVESRDMLLFCNRGFSPSKHYRDISSTQSLNCNFGFLPQTHNFCYSF